MDRLKGKVAIVTGAGRGIGRGIALTFASEGAKVVINDLGGAGNGTGKSIEPATEVVNEIKKSGGEAVANFASVADVNGAESIIKTALDSFGRIDILVNNAGILSQAPFQDLTEEQWDQVMAVNLKGQFLCSQEAVKLMKPGSKIINLASIASGGVGVGFGLIAHYTASKGGVVALTENMAVDLAAKGINTNAIAPGVIESDMTKGMLADEQYQKGLLARIPKGKAGKPEDIGAAAAFLASDEASYITGTVLYVDGGWLAG